MDQRRQRRENHHPSFPQLHLHFIRAPASALDTKNNGRGSWPCSSFKRYHKGIPFFLLLNHSTTMLNKFQLAFNSMQTKEFLRCEDNLIKGQ